MNYEGQWQNGKEYLLHKFYDYRTAKEKRQGVRETINLIHGELQKLSSMNVEDAEVNGDVVFSGNYLVKNEAKGFFCSKVNTFQGVYPELKFLLTGPWPPYNFVVEN